MDVVSGHHASGSSLDIGLRLLGAGGDEVGAEAFAEVSGEIAEGLSVFANANMELNDRLTWQTTAGLKWRF